MGTILFPIVFFSQLLLSCTLDWVHAKTCHILSSKWGGGEGYVKILFHAFRILNVVHLSTYLHQVTLLVTCKLAASNDKLSIHLQASNAYLQFSQGPGTNMIFEFLKEMPKPETKIRLDLSSLLGTLLFTLVVLQLFPVTMSNVLHLS
jgi:hypothetical protein